MGEQLQHVIIKVQKPNLAQGWYTVRNHTQPAQYVALCRPKAGPTSTTLAQDRIKQGKLTVPAGMSPTPTHKLLKVKD